MKPVAEVRPLGPDDRPPELIDFVFEYWTRPEDHQIEWGYNDANLYQKAYSRQSEAQARWCEANGVSYLECMKADRRRRFPNGVG